VGWPKRCAAGQWSLAAALPYMQPQRMVLYWGCGKARYRAEYFSLVNRYPILLRSISSRECLSPDYIFISSPVAFLFHSELVECFFIRFNGWGSQSVSLDGKMDAAIEPCLICWWLISLFRFFKYLLDTFLKHDHPYFLFQPAAIQNQFKLVIGVYLKKHNGLIFNQYSAGIHNSSSWFV